MSRSSLTWTNLTGLILSVVCVIHCMLMPLCLASLPAWGLDWLVSPRVHQLLALAGVAIGLATLIPGWREHRKSAVIVLALLGLSVMNYAAFVGEACCVECETDNSTEALISCCQTCLSDGLNSDASGTMVSLNSAVTLPGNIWQWLWRHPTAFGAMLLAWAHCLNGHCSRRCCQQANDGTPTYQLQC